jgi:hypothetical protein
MNSPPTMLEHLKSEKELEEVMEQARGLVAAFDNTNLVPPQEPTNGATTNSNTAPATNAREQVQQTTLPLLPTLIIVQLGSTNHKYGYNH